MRQLNVVAFSLKEVQDALKWLYRYGTIMDEYLILRDKRMRIMRTDPLVILMMGNYALDEALILDYHSKVPRLLVRFLHSLNTYEGVRKGIRRVIADATCYKSAVDEYELINPIQTINQVKGKNDDPRIVGLLETLNYRIAMLMYKDGYNIKDYE